MVKMTCVRAGIQYDPAGVLCNVSGGINMSDLGDESSTLSGGSFINVAAIEAAIADVVSSVFSNLNTLERAAITQWVMNDYEDPSAVAESTIQQDGKDDVVEAARKMAVHAVDIIRHDQTELANAIALGKRHLPRDKSPTH